MIPVNIECTWGTIAPSIFTREVLVHLPYILSFNRDRPCGRVETREMKISMHRTIGGREGEEILAKTGDIEAPEIHDMIKRAFPFNDLKTIRLRGECLTRDGYEFISDLAEHIIDTGDGSRIIVETTLRLDGAWERMLHLMKRGLVDHACLYMLVPGDDADTVSVDRNIEIILNGLTGCIMAIREDNLRSINLCFVINEHSSINMMEKILSRVKADCMSDDYYRDAPGIAMFTFNVTFLPVNDTNHVNEMVSRAVSQMSINYFQDDEITVIPPELSRVSEWIEF